MCGILFNYGLEKIDKHHHCLSSIKHRGPDNVEVKSFDFKNYWINIGHRRLSIIDLSNDANQPMSYQNLDIWITYNGELYNYKELKSQLIKHGYIFKTNSDTEVVLTSYIQWGKDCLNMFNGMFSFAIWDNKNKKLFAARDRYGIKPMYFWKSKNNFSLCSEIKQLTQFNEFDAKIENESVYQFLEYGNFAYSNKTMWKNVFELEPGHFLDINFNSWIFSKEIKVIKWYNLNFKDQKIYSYNDAKSYYENIFSNSVKKRLQSDVNISALISGGLDSTSVASILYHKFSAANKLKTYSIVYDENEFSEKEYIDIVNKKFNFDFTLINYSSKNYFEDLEKIIWHNDLPVVGRSIVSHYNLYQNIDSKKFKVAIEGQGADESLCGYSSYHLGYILQLMSQFKFSKSYNEYNGYIKTRKGDFISDMKSLFLYSSPQLFNMLKRTKPNSGFYNFPMINPSSKINRSERNLDKIYLERFSILRSILHSVDRVSMSNSIETRVPFLDHELVEFSISQPIEFKIRNGLRKSLLRDSLKKYLPNEIFNRKDKMGFSSPEKKWLSNELKLIFLNNLSDAANLPFVKKDIIFSEIDSIRKNKKQINQSLVRLSNLKRWIDIFNINL